MSALPKADADNVVSELPRPKGPGARLQAARKSRDLEIKDIAEALYIRQDQLIALEADDYEHLPARVYVLGYLKKYARHVNIPEQAIIKAFNEFHPEQEQDTHVHRVHADAQGVRDSGVNQSSGGFPFLSVLVVVILAAGLYAWYEGKFSGTVTSDSQPQPLAENGLTTPVEQEPVTAAQTQIPLQVTQPVNVEPGAQPVAAIAIPALNEPVTEKTVKPIVESVVSEPATPAAEKPVAVDVDITEAEVVTADVAEPVIEETPVAVLPEIVVSFSELCWVDIRDSAKTFKYMRQAKPGVSKTITGTPPFKMLFGNVQGVKMTINGEPFDLQRYNKANVARFVFDPADY